MQSFCVIKLYYLGMAVNYHGIFVTNVIKHNLTQNGRKYFGMAVNYSIIALAPGSTL
jgi:hypothetical protein